MPLRLKAFLFSRSLLDCMLLSRLLQELSMCSQLALQVASLHPRRSLVITSAY